MVTHVIHLTLITCELPCVTFETLSVTATFGKTITPSLQSADAFPAKKMQIQTPTQIQTSIRNIIITVLFFKKPVYLVHTCTSASTLFICIRVS